MARRRILSASSECDHSGTLLGRRGESAEAREEFPADAKLVAAEIGGDEVASIPLLRADKRFQRAGRRVKPDDVAVAYLCNGAAGLRLRRDMDRRRHLAGGA